MEDVAGARNPSMHVSALYVSKLPVYLCELVQVNVIINFLLAD